MRGGSCSWGISSIASVGVFLVRLLKSLFCSLPLRVSRRCPTRLELRRVDGMWLWPGGLDILCSQCSGLLHCFFCLGVLGPVSILCRFCFWGEGSHPFGLGPWAIPRAPHSNIFTSRFNICHENKWQEPKILYKRVLFLLRGHSLPLCLEGHFHMPFCSGFPFLWGVGRGYRVQRPPVMQLRHG